jgi:hypothetical protein
MFDSKQSLTYRLADTADLVIDFATLGEYGLEPLEQAAARPCEARARHSSRRSTGSWRAAIDHFSTNA